MRSTEIIVLSGCHFSRETNVFAEYVEELYRMASTSSSSLRIAI